MSVDRYSQFVASMRWLLPMAALIVMAALVLWPLLSTERQIIEPMVSEIDELGADSMTLEGPHYIGHTKLGDRIDVTANSAQFDTSNEDLITLFDIDGRIHAKDAIHITARKATYDRKLSHMTLEGDVTMINASGYRIVSSFAEIDMAASIIQGSVPIMAEGPAGRLEAQDYVITDGGSKVRFGGRVRTTIQLQ